MLGFSAALASRWVCHVADTSRAELPAARSVHADGQRRLQSICKWAEGRLESLVLMMCEAQPVMPGHEAHLD